MQINERCGNGKSRKPTYKFLFGTNMSPESNVDRLSFIPVSPHELILNFLFRVRQSPSMDRRTRKKHVLLHRAHNIVFFSWYEKDQFEALDR